METFIGFRLEVRHILEPADQYYIYIYMWNIALYGAETWIFRKKVRRVSKCGVGHGDKRGTSEKSGGGEMNSSYNSEKERKLD